MTRIESLLSARLFLAPEVAGNHLYFISNLSGRLSLYAMPLSGGVPQPLLPPHIALQNPELTGEHPFIVFPALGCILVMIDRDGDEQYQPMRIPIDGGFPEPAFGEQFTGMRVFCGECDRERGIVYLTAESNSEQRYMAYQGDLATGELIKLGESKWGSHILSASADHTHAILSDTYTFGDSVLSLWTRGQDSPRLLYGTPLEDRQPHETVIPTGISAAHITPDGEGVLLITSLFCDTYGLGFLPLREGATVEHVAIEGTRHSGVGELTTLKHVNDNRYLLGYNIDGVSWLYLAQFDWAKRQARCEAVLCGEGELASGVVEHVTYEPTSNTFAFAFCSATTPTQLYTVQPGRAPQRYTNERLLGLPHALLAPGEDASFESHDGLRISARLYMPAAELGFSGPRPLVYYVHGGPQSQERPNFAWFSMPLIQFLTLNGFAVFVPNVRGSTGYGIGYMKQVDRDWGGDDRLDHVHAMALLEHDPRINTSRAAVIGRSYGGYMTLTLAARHPELWSAAVDMFGPYDLLSFMDRIPETWKPYFAIAVGDPANDRDFLVERSPRTYIERLACPLLVIQGKNDPRVVERESRDVVEQLRAAGKHVEYLMFEDEGHDVLKFENRVRCYNAIVNFFKQHLM